MLRAAGATLNHTRYMIPCRLKVVVTTRLPPCSSVCEICWRTHAALYVLQPMNGIGGVKILRIT